MLQAHLNRFDMFRRLTALFTPVLVLQVFFSCKRGEKETLRDTLFESMPSSQTGIDFINTVKDTKDMNILNYHNFYNGGGVAIGDVNNDGKPDIFFTSNQGENKL